MKSEREQQDGREGEGERQGGRERGRWARQRECVDNTNFVNRSLWLLNRSISRPRSRKRPINVGEEGGSANV